jgi:hypothetical protein
MLTSDGFGQKFLAHIRHSRPIFSFRGAQAATLPEFLTPLTNCFVRRWFCVVLGPKSPLHHHNWLSSGKFQDKERFLIPCPSHVSSRLPPVVNSASTPWRLLPKKLGRDSLPIDMLLSTVCLGRRATEFGSSGGTYELLCDSVTNAKLNRCS